MEESDNITVNNTCSVILRSFLFNIYYHKFLSLDVHFFFSSSFLASGFEPVWEAREPMALRMASLLGSTPGRFSRTLWRKSESCMTS